MMNCRALWCGVLRCVALCCMCQMSIVGGEEEEGGFGVGDLLSCACRRLFCHGFLRSAEHSFIPLHNTTLGTSLQV